MSICFSLFLFFAAAFPISFSLQKVDLQYSLHRVVTLIFIFLKQMVLSISETGVTYRSKEYNQLITYANAYFITLRYKILILYHYDLKILSDWHLRCRLYIIICGRNNMPHQSLYECSSLGHFLSKSSSYL